MVNYNFQIIASLLSRDGQQITILEIPFKKENDIEARNYIVSEEFETKLKETLSQVNRSLYTDNLILELMSTNRVVQTIISSFSEILD